MVDTYAQISYVTTWSIKTKIVGIKKPSLNQRGPTIDSIWFVCVKKEKESNRQKMSVSICSLRGSDQSVCLKNHRATEISVSAVVTGSQTLDASFQLARKEGGVEGLATREYL